MNSGEIGFAHLTVMARTMNAVPDRFQEGRLLEQARENSPGKFHHICRHFRHAADPKGYAAEQAEQVENRSLHLSMWEDGSYLINGILDAVGGAAVRTALEPLARASGEDDTRERDRRLADALVELAEGSMQRPQIQTDLSNLILLCHRHHWMVHEGHWQIVRSDDGRMLTIPPTTTFGQLARGPD